MFDTLQERLAETFKGLRAKGRLTQTDIDATMREIRIALLEADVNLGVVKQFVAAVKERCLGVEISRALNPSQQIIKIVNEELIGILGGRDRPIRFAKKPPTVIMLAGLQGAGKTTLAGKLGRWLRSEKHSPLLVACDLQRPNAVNQLQIVGERGRGCTSSRRNPETASATRFTWPVQRSNTLNAISTTWWSSIPQAGWASTRC